MRQRLASLFALALALALLVPVPTAVAQVSNTDATYTTDADFDQGTLVSVNHDAPYNDQLQLDSPTEPFPFINVAASGRGTVVRVNTDTGEVVGEYRTAPEGDYGLDPSRTTVDLFGNVWTANRGEVGEIDGVLHGSAVKIGLIVGGTRVDAAGQPKADGGFLAPPFGYSTCVDRDQDGLIRTSAGLLDALPWNDITDGLGGQDGIVEDAADECILLFQRLPDAEAARHVSVDADNNVWVGGYPFDLRHFYNLDGTTGAIIDSFDARDIGCGGYGGLIDGNGVLWSIGWGWGEGPLLRYDPATSTGTCVNTYGGYGLGIDTNGYVWASIWENGIAKVSPDGVLEPGFPKSTYLSPSSATGPVSPLFMADKPELASIRFAVQADPTFWVAPADEWVQSQSPWTPGATISLTIEDGGETVYADSQTADGEGNFHFGFWDIFDLQPGHDVTVSDGITTWTHSVTELAVHGVDVGADSLSGQADPGLDVEIWVHNAGSMSATPDSSGSWTADVSGVADLTYLSDGGSGQYDANGNATAVWWAAPRLQVSPDDNWVQSSGTWQFGAVVTMSIEEAGVEIHSDSAVVDERGWNFELNETFDLQRGQLVTVSDGSDTKTHTVANLYADGVDVVADTVLGRADAGTDVDVWAHEGGQAMATADGSGNWVADFSGQLDLTYLSDGGSQQVDVDGDSTGDWWSTPAIIVSPDEDAVGTDRPWTPGAAISLTVEAGGVEVYTDSQTADDSGNWAYHLGGTFDIERGHVVTVSDGVATKTHTVIDLYVDGVDVDAETVFGRASPNTMLDVWIDGGSGVVPTADSSGNWIADFGGVADVTYTSNVGAQQGDNDGDATSVQWSSPSFQVAPDDRWVQAQSPWTRNGTISLTVRDGIEVVHSDSQIADGDGYFYFDFGESFDLLRGHEVTVSDGTTTKVHEVIPLFVEGVDVAGDIVFGRGQADTDVDVWVHDNGGLTVAADSDGNWSANFSGQTDLTYASDGGSQQFDDDGDSTGVWWSSPSFQVQPDNDWIGSWSRWPADTPLSVVIDGDNDPLNGTLHEASVTTNGNGEFGLELNGAFDVVRGHFVTVSDGTAAKVHQVIDLFVTEVDLFDDTVRGTAAPFSVVEVQVHSEEGAWRMVEADGSGVWAADFSVVTGEGDNVADIGFGSHVGANQYDDDLDVTWVDWQTTQFRVNPDAQEIRGTGWVPNSSVTVQVDDDDPVTPPLYQVTAYANQGGDLEVQDWDFDLIVGHEVTVNDGTNSKSLILADLGEPTIGFAADVITGTASPGATVEVSVSDFLHHSVRWVVADEISGMWTADFSVDDGGYPAFDITEQSFVQVAELDDDGDGTTGRFGPPIQANRGVAVTPVDNHVWVANSGTGTVARLDNDGNVLATIDTGGDEPTGVAIDAAGKVWVTNQFSDNTVRIDPSAGSDGLGAVDMTVELGEGASPYNYSDMTGAVVVGSTSPQGFWTVVQDSGEADFEWGRISWNTEPGGFEPAGTEIVVEARTANTEAGLGGAVFAPVSDGELFSSFGRFIEVRVTLKANPGGVSPVLSDIRVQPALIEVDLDIKPGSFPNSINVKRSTGDIPVAVLGSADFDVTTIDVTTLLFGPAPAIPDHELTDPATYSDHLEDVNEDGYLDLVSHFRIADVAFVGDETSACLVGETLSGIPIEGCDSVRLIGKKR